MMSFACATMASDRMAATVNARVRANSRARLRISLNSCRILAPVWNFARGGASRLIALLCLLAIAPAARAGEPVAIQLVLALDTSASVDSNEFALEVDGFAQAF